MTVEPEMTRAEYARHIGRTRQYVGQLVAAGRVVLTDDGARVRVVESDALLAATADPAREYVAQRHARDRARKDGAAAQPPAAQAAGAALADDDVEEDINFQRSKARREHFAALKAELEYRREAGQLIELAAHNSAFARLGSEIRARLEALNTSLPPLLVDKDEVGIRRVIADVVGELLSDLVKASGAIARDVSQRSEGRE